jgi:hypothetical protein
VNFIKRCLRNWTSLLIIGFTVCTLLYLVRHGQWIGLLGWAVALLVSYIAADAQLSLDQARLTIQMQSNIIDGWKQLYQKQGGERRGSQGQTSRPA